MPPIPRRTLIRACLAVLALGGMVAFYTLTHDAPAFDKTSVSLETHDGRRINLTMEIAVTPQQQKYGLMFRHSLPDDAGMLFLWDKDQIITMWMENTLIPLDMLFIHQGGYITKIITNAEPMSRAILSSEQPARAVIELKAGAAARYNLRTGDKIIYPALNDTK